MAAPEPELMMHIHTSAAAYAGPLTPSALAKLVASAALAEDTELWLAAAAGKGARHRRRLADVVDFEEMSEVDVDDEEEIDELAQMLADGLPPGEAC